MSWEEFKSFLASFVQANGDFNINVGEIASYFDKPLSETVELVKKYIFEGRLIARLSAESLLNHENIVLVLSPLWDKTERRKLLNRIRKLHNVAENLMSLGEYEKALEICHDALSVIGEFGEEACLLRTYWNPMLIELGK